MIYFVENSLWLKISKLNMKLRIQQIYKYNIHIGVVVVVVQKK
jgi:hypothetical protein